MPSYFVATIVRRSMAQNNLIRRHARAILALLLAVITLPAILMAADAPQITKVEPPNWWVGYQPSLMVLLYGENLAGAKLSVSYPGVKVSKSDVQPDGKHAFLWLALDKQAKPGTLKISAKTDGGATTADLSLLARPSAADKYAGVTRDDVIYLIMPDRFADGDQSNDQPKGAAPGTYDRAAAKTYHGGDLKGVQQHLPYLKDLGVTTIWLTPLYDNSDETSDYHGYGATDIYAVEDHFGTMQDFQNLVDAAHTLHMKVLLDMVPNHVGPKNPWAASQPAPGWLHGTLANHINTDYDYVPITDPHAVEKNYRSALEGWFANVLPDLAQENPLVAEYLRQNALWWIESSGVDGFRIDTFPYVPRAFWPYYFNGIFGEYPHFFAVGEIYNFDPTVTSYFAGGQRGFDNVDTLLPTPFDFPMNSAIRDVINHGAPATRIVDVLRQDRLYPHPEILVTFMGNHDMKRFLTDADGSTDKLKLAYSLLTTLRGIPELYYGDEIAMTGGDDPDNRHDFPGGFAGDAHDAFAASGRTPEQQDMYAHVQKWLKLRSQHEALREGTQRHVGAGDTYYAFTREGKDERLLVVFHSGAAPEFLSISLSGTSIANAKSFTPLLDAPAAQVKDGYLQVQSPPYSVAVYRVE